MKEGVSLGQPLLPHGLHGGQPGHGGHHHARKQLHGRDVSMVKRVGYGREHLKDTQRAPIVAKRGDKDRTGSETAAASQIDSRIGFGVMTEENFAGANAFGGKARIGLEMDAQVGSGATGTRAADDFA